MCQNVPSPIRRRFQPAAEIAPTIPGGNNAGEPGCRSTSADRVRLAASGRIPAICQAGASLPPRRSDDARREQLPDRHRQPPSTPPETTLTRLPSLRRAKPADRQAASGPNPGRTTERRIDRSPPPAPLPQPAPIRAPPVKSEPTLEERREFDQPHVGRRRGHGRDYRHPAVEQSRAISTWW